VKGQEADELGRTGQSRFQYICNRAGLICNEAIYDRMGWDFIVEFRQEEHPALPFDSRIRPLRCHFQVKTIREPKTRFYITLSAIEPLAKGAEPAFIYVLQCNAVGEFTAAFLIHLLDDNLARVLKRLRREFAAGNTALNKKKITMDAARVGVHLAPSGAELRGAIEAACNGDLSQYIARKTAQLERLGFESRPFHGAMNIHAGSYEGFVDTLLGLKTDVPISNLQSYETRFDIKLPLPEMSGAGTITIQPSPVDHCTLAIRQNALEEPIIFQGNMYIPPIRLPSEHFKSLLNFTLFSITLDRRRLTLTGNDKAIESGTQSPRAWCDYWAFLRILTTGPGIIDINTEIQQLNFSHAFTKGLNVIPPDQCESWLNICCRASHLLTTAGIVDQPALSLQELYLNSKRILSASAVLKGEPVAAHWKIEKPVESDHPQSFESLFIDYIEFGSVRLIYYATARANLTEDGDHLILELTDIVARQISPIGPDSERYEAFIEAVKRSTGIANTIRGWAFS
jgi:hypothetical protein